MRSRPPAIERASHHWLRLKLTIAYDGASFRGWQSQATGDTVQDHLERAFVALCGERLVVHGAGRTDAGVHALGQVAHVDVPADRFPFSRWMSAINGHLPPAIRVLKTARAAPDFHARWDARRKIYHYRIWAAPFLHPLEQGRAWHVPKRLDLDLLRDCAAMLVGRHDFAGFAANRGGKKERETTRTLHEIAVRRSGALLTLRFTGDGFLYRMVRLLTGTLIRCAQRRMEPDYLATLLAGKGRMKTSFAAPPDGLYLVRVIY